MNRFIRKTDNRGATLIFAVVTIMAISVLVTLILSIAVSNYRNKATDYKTKQDFYSAEVAADEIYAAIGTYGIDYVGQAYNYTLTNFSKINPDNSNNYIIVNNSTQLNEVFKKDYMSRMIEYLLMHFERDEATGAYTLTRTGGYTASTISDQLFGTGADVDAFNASLNSSAANIGYVVEKLYDYLSVPAGGRIEISYAADDAGRYMYFNKDEFKFVINNIHIKYSEGLNVSEETFDIVIKFPDWSLSYSEARNLSNPYINYALIGDEGLYFYRSSVTVNGGMYGGGTPKTEKDASIGGITIDAARVTLNPAGDGTPISGAVVTNADIVVKSGTVSGSEANLLVNNGKVWCTNISVPVVTGTSAPVTNSYITLNSLTRTYVQDDLEINEENNITTINGDYYGFGADIYDGSAAKSSAIVINGKNARVTVSPTNRLFLAGRAYININGSDHTNYLTGESVALRGNQQAYLIPSAWMKSGETNPGTSGDNPASRVDLGKIPANLRALLVNGNEVVSKKSLGNFFYYFNFKTTSDDASLSEDGAVTFIKNAMSGVYDGNGVSFSSIINGGNNAMDVSGVTVNLTGASSVAGATAVSDGHNVSVTGGYNTSGITSTACKDLKNRYMLMYSILVDVDDSEIVYDKEYAGGKRYQQQYFNFSPFNNYVIYNTLTQSPYNNLSGYVNGLTGASSVYVIYKVGDLDFNPSGGVTYIVVCDGNVKVNGSFSGLLMATGEVELSSNAVINAAPDAVDDALENGTVGGVRIGEIFEYYKTRNNSLENIDAINYTDVVEYSNWRKY